MKSASKVNLDISAVLHESTSSSSETDQSEEIIPPPEPRWSTRIKVPRVTNTKRPLGGHRSEEVIDLTKALNTKSGKDCISVYEELRRVRFYKPTVKLYCRPIKIASNIRTINLRDVQAVPPNVTQRRAEQQHALLVNPMIGKTSQIYFNVQTS